MTTWPPKTFVVYNESYQLYWPKRETILVGNIASAKQYDCADTAKQKAVQLTEMESGFFNRETSWAAYEIRLERV